MALTTPLCDLLGVRYPIIQTGMGWVAYPPLVAAVSEAGGLGILAAATMAPPEVERAIQDVRERTASPFGVNFRPDQVGVERVVDLIVGRGVRVASFGRAPRADLIRHLKDNGVVTIATVGAGRHAQKVAEWGVDAVIAQGTEGGGHTGAVPTLFLIPQVVAAGHLPVIGAGGFYDGRGLVAALALGAVGVAMGTRFLLTQESGVPRAVKQRYLSTDISGTVVTRRIDGAPQRVILTEFIRQLQGDPVRQLIRGARSALALRQATRTPLLDLLREGHAMHKSMDLSWSQVMMAASAPMLTRESMVQGRTDGILPSGQVAGMIDDLPTCEELVQRIVREAEATLHRLAA
jgi:NAD(P)H-dependent flavin oxidoreductase YrpB (nitropropane dioxygenase family)